MEVADGKVALVARAASEFRTSTVPLSGEN
jgi:hypothetical protein